MSLLSQQLGLRNDRIQVVKLFHVEVIRVQAVGCFRPRIVEMSGQVKHAYKVNEEV